VVWLRLLDHTLTFGLSPRSSTVVPAGKSVGSIFQITATGRAESALPISRNSSASARGVVLKIFRNGARSFENPFIYRSFPAELGIYMHKIITSIQPDEADSMK
jgi:hypothetical protein